MKEIPACLAMTITPSGLLLQAVQKLAGLVLTKKLKPLKPETLIAAGKPSNPLIPDHSNHKPLNPNP